jgi:hypothetical protein
MAPVAKGSRTREGEGRTRSEPLAWGVLPPANAPRLIFTMGSCAQVFGKTAMIRQFISRFSLQSSNRDYPRVLPPHAYTVRLVCGLSFLSR